MIHLILSSIFLRAFTFNMSDSVAKLRLVIRLTSAARDIDSDHSEQGNVGSDVRPS
jgi:hypothetical protein